MSEGLMSGLPLGYVGENTPYVQKIENLRALLRQAEEAWAELSFMLREHERIALLVQQPPWFIAPMSRPIREMDAIITAIRALLRETATP